MSVRVQIKKALWIHVCDSPVECIIRLPCVIHILGVDLITTQTKFSDIFLFRSIVNLEVNFRSIRKMRFCQRQAGKSIKYGFFSAHPKSDHISNVKH